MINSENWAIVLWKNPRHAENTKQRFMETITAAGSTDPVAFPLEYLHKHLPNAIFSEDSDSLDYFDQSSEEKPLVVPVYLAKRTLGIEKFSYSDTTKEE